MAELAACTSLQRCAAPSRLGCLPAFRRKPAAPSPAHLTPCSPCLTALQFGSIALPGERLRDLTPQRLRMLPMRARKLAAGAR